MTKQVKLTVAGISAFVVVVGACVWGVTGPHFQSKTDKEVFQVQAEMKASDPYSPTGFTDADVADEMKKFCSELRTMSAAQIINEETDSWSSYESGVTQVSPARATAKDVYKETLILRSAMRYQCPQHGGGDNADSVQIELKNAP